MSEGLQHNFSQPMNGGLALAEMLRAHGADTMFGMGGFQLSPFYEAVRILGLGHNLINDERCGAFMADAYARVTGKPGVCDGTLGPGVTNLVTGMVESLNAGVPMIVIAGDEPLALERQSGHAGVGQIAQHQPGVIGADRKLSCRVKGNRHTFAQNCHASTGLWASQRSGRGRGIGAGRDKGRTFRHAECFVNFRSGYSFPCTAGGRRKLFTCG